MAILKLLAWFFGVGLLCGGSVMFVLAKMFGAGGLFDRHRRDVASEIAFGGAAAVGVGLLAFAAFS